MRDEPFAERYTLLTRLSAGATGEVWRAQDLHGGGVVALKRWTEVNADPRRHAFEVAALQAVQHPCVPSLIDHGRAQGLCYVAMTLFEGPTLRAVLNGPLSPAAVRALGLAVCDPLGAVHRAGLVHRDVKPEHLVLDTSVWPTRVSLVDLGLAHALGAPHAVTAGGVVGSLGYVPPEQLRGAPPPADPRWDVFSLGCVLAECATGQAPFAAEDPRAVVARTLLGAQLPLGRVPAPLASLIRAMTAPRPEDRPADADAVAARLHAISDAALTAAGGGHLAVVLGHAASADAPSGTTPMMFDGATVDPTVLPGDAAARVLGDGSIVVWMAVDRLDATAAARVLQCAVLLAGRYPGQRWSAVVGEGDASGPWPRGPCLDAALALRDAGDAGEVSTDAVTALLAAERFALTPRGAHFVIPARGSQRATT
ncbi:MAG: serine/threonine-protein kinase [Polyangiales bacterium]